MWAWVCVCVYVRVQLGIAGKQVKYIHPEMERINEEIDTETFKQLEISKFLQVVKASPSSNYPTRRNVNITIIYYVVKIF